MRTKVELLCSRARLPEFAERHGLTLLIRQVSRHPPEWKAQLEGVRVKHGPLRTDTWGHANSPLGAVHDYLRAVSGQWLLFRGQEVLAPEDWAPVVLGDLDIEEEVVEDNDAE